MLSSPSFFFNINSLYASVFIKWYKQLNQKAHMSHPQRKAMEAFRNLHWVWALNATENTEWKDLMEAYMEVWAAAK